MKTSNWIAILLLWLVSITTSAAVPSHISARFKQVRTVALLAQEQTATGRFTFDEPGQVTWTYDDGVSAQLPKEMLTFIRRAVTGDFMQENPDFFVSEENGLTVLKPKRRQLKQFFKAIHIRLDANTGIAQEVILYDVTDDVTLIQFSDVETR